MPADYALTHRCPACHGVAELVGMTGTALVYECACGERVEEGRLVVGPIVLSKWKWADEDAPGPTQQIRFGVVGPEEVY